MLSSPHQEENIYQINIMITVKFQHFLKLKSLTKTLRFVSFVLTKKSKLNVLTIFFSTKVRLMNRLVLNELLGINYKISFGDSTRAAGFSTKRRSDKQNKMNFKQYQTEMINTRILTKINNLLTFFRRFPGHIYFRFSPR